MRMTSLFKRLAPALVAAVILSACSSLTQARAATVNGDVIAASDLEGELLDIRDNDAYREAVERTLSQQGLGVSGDGQGSFDTAFAARLLSLGVFFELIGQEARERGIDVSAADIEDARSATVESVGGEEVFAAFSPDYQDKLISRQALATKVQVAVAPPPDEADARALYDEDPSQFAAVCVSHIFVSADRGPEEAQARIEDLARQIDQGADFRVLASEQSDDAQAAAQGGSLGCQPRGSFLPSFEEAAFSLPVGVVSPPVETEVGFHLILVDERREVPFEEVQAQVLNSLERQRVETFSTFVNEVTCDADVEVNPRYGSWTGACEDLQQEGQVLPPEGPPEATSPLDPAVPGGGAVRPGG